MYYIGSGHNFKEIYAFSYPTVFRYLENKIKGKDISDFFYENKINSIAICIRGVLNNLGELFYNDIINSGIEVKYFIDKNYFKAFSGGISGVPVVGTDGLSEQKSVDAYVVAPVYYFNEIAEDLISAGIELKKIISLNDIVFSI
jgi:hypothetical protein